MKAEKNKIILEEIVEGHLGEGFCCGQKRKVEIIIDFETPKILERIFE